MQLPIMKIVAEADTGQSATRLVYYHYDDNYVPVRETIRDPLLPPTKIMVWRVRVFKRV